VLAILVLAVCFVLSIPLGAYLAWALGDADGRGLRGRLDRLGARVGGSLAARPQQWRGYLISLLAFNAVLFSVSYLILLAQGGLPLNPDGKAGLSADLAFNTAASFTTNTNLQHYSGEQQLSYFSQLFAIAWLQFVSAATGLAALAALCRGLAGKADLGNFFRDLLRATVLVFLPLALVLGLAFIVSGVPMTLAGAAQATTLEGLPQSIARGPVAAVLSIKQLGTNGGGYFGPNSAHPFENPSALTNLLSNIAILLLPMAAVWFFGHSLRARRQAVTVFAVMLVLLVGMTGLAIRLEQAPAAALAGLPVAEGPNLEGKELRFGADAGALWAASTTATSNGSVNAMHDSLNPLTGLVPLTGMWLNVAFGGVGVGFINMFLFILTAVFIAGTMVGRTPEYLGKKIEAREMKLAVIAILVHPFLILGGTALFAATPWGQTTVQEQGPHGLSEIAYEFSSAAANNGSGFEGLGDNTPPWNVATGLAMLLGRFLPIALPLAIAGSLAAKRRQAESAGTFRTDTPLFAALLLGIVLILGALLFLPLAVLGPIADHLQSARAALGA